MLRTAAPLSVVLTSLIPRAAPPGQEGARGRWTEGAARPRGPGSWGQENGTALQAWKRTSSSRPAATAAAHPVRHASACAPQELDEIARALLPSVEEACAPPHGVGGGWHGTTFFAPQEVWERGLRAHAGAKRYCVAKHCESGLLRKRSDAGEASAFRSMTEQLAYTDGCEGAVDFTAHWDKNSCGFGPTFTLGTGWVYELCNVPYWDVMKMSHTHPDVRAFLERVEEYGGDTPLHEKCVPADIPSAHVRRAGVIEWKSRREWVLREWVANPHFDERFGGRGGGVWEGK